MPKLATVRRLYWTAVLTAVGWNIVLFGGSVVWALNQPPSTPTGSASEWSPGPGMEWIGYAFIFFLGTAVAAGFAAGIAALVMARLVRRATPVQSSVPAATSAGRMVGLSSWAAFGAGTAGVLIWWLVIVGGLYAITSLLVTSLA